MTSNTLRMPFAEWLFRMAEAQLSPPKRVVAVYAAAFDITGNSELQELTGLSERTLDGIKKQLPKDGFVIVQSGVGGRGHGVKVSPAYKETPVTFTDVSPRNPSKFYPRKDCGTPAYETGVNPTNGAGAAGVEAETPAKSAPVAKKVSPTPPSKKLNNYKPLTVEQEAASAGGTEIAGLNGATSLIVNTLAGWINPFAPDPAFAYTQVSEAVRMFGDIAVRDGFAELKADIADNRVRAPSVKQFYGYIRTARDRKPATSKPQRDSEDERFARLMKNI